MRLQRIHARRYRTFEDIDIQFSRNYCTISGKNNAGKSNIIRLIEFFAGDEFGKFVGNEKEFDYKSDLTQWISNEKVIAIDYIFEISPVDDPALMHFICKFLGRDPNDCSIDLKFSYSISEGDETKLTLYFNNEEIEEKAAKEIEQKFSVSKTVIVHNSTNNPGDFFYSRVRPRTITELTMNRDEANILQELSAPLNQKINELGRKHLHGLEDAIKKFSDQFEVEAKSSSNQNYRRVLFSIGLKDRNVSAPIDEWGSGTKNKTQILLEMVYASKAKAESSLEERITPIVVIEEPESFRIRRPRLNLAEFCRKWPAISISK